MLRLESCAKRVEDFLEGRIECVEELEEELLDMEGNGRELQHRPVYELEWNKIATPNLL